MRSVLSIYSPPSVVRCYNIPFIHESSTTCSFTHIGPSRPAILQYSRPFVVQGRVSCWALLKARTAASGGFQTVGQHCLAVVTIGEGAVAATNLWAACGIVKADFRRGHHITALGLVGVPDAPAELERIGTTPPHKCLDFGIRRVQVAQRATHTRFEWYVLPAR